MVKQMVQKEGISCHNDALSVRHASIFTDRRNLRSDLVNPGRVTAWREAYKKTHKSYGELHANTVYFARYGQEGSDSGNWIEIVDKGVDLIHAELPFPIKEGLAAHCSFQVQDTQIQCSSGRPLNLSDDNTISKEAEFQLATLFQRLYSLKTVLRSM